MQRNYATLAILGLSLALSACSKNKDAGSNPTETPAAPGTALTVLKYEAQCAEGADSCVGQHGFTVTLKGSEGTFLAGPIPSPAEGEKATREGALDAEKAKELQELVAKAGPQGEASTSQSSELEAEVAKTQSSKISLVQGDVSVVLVSTEGKKLNHRGNSADAQALHTALFALAERHYFNPCTDAVLELEALQTQARSCNTDADCGYAYRWNDPSGAHFYEAESKPGSWIQTASCAQVQPLAAANLAFLAKDNLFAMHAKVQAACGDKFYRSEGCGDKGFEIGSLNAVCVSNQCRVNPEQAITN